MDARALLRHRTRRVFLPLGCATLALAVLAGCSGGGGTSSTPTPPAVTVTVSGNSQARIGTTVQYTATVANNPNTTVTWQVNGVAGGATATGTISASGLYTPPTALPNPNTVTITAISQAVSTASGSLTATLLNPQPTVTNATVAVSGSTDTITVNGTNFVSGAQVQLQGQTFNATINSSTQLTATASLSLPAGTTTIPITVINPNPGSIASSSFNALVTTPASITAAARLLDQATFGPTLTDIQHVESVGIAGYLNEQFNTAPTTLPLIAATPPTPCATNLVPCLQSEWWQATLTAPDQLRQRVAFALAEMFVVSTNSVNSRAVVAFQNTLVNDAFGNFSTIMKDVTLSPAMGAYLNMLNSNKPGTVNGVPQIANENYARELMQLFTMGLVLLNPDGTAQLDSSGNTIPTYTQAQVQAFARAYTGWTYANADGSAPSKFPNGTANYTMPMAAVDANHDTTAKILLNGTTLPAGQTSAQDLDGALANIFAHPNVGPFVCKQLIQHLVASNPSPAYVQRVAAVFANNGNNVRGDMKAVITAILTDTEARAGDTNATAEGGHLREPMLWLTNMVRGLGFVNNDAKAGNDVIANASYNTLGNYTSSLSERPYASPSVFNFFPPDYVIPSTTTNAPEFSLENTASAVLRLSLANTVVFNKISGFTVDLSATSPLGAMASNPGNLVDALGMLFMHSQMSTQMRTAIVNHISTFTDPAQRVRVATYLVITSSQYKILH
ncbi:DUF1800 domain-containing protein [Edaphobacter flagellatus]|uniref:DUF1800 domain-containing protein n=1 Tax=Edaphobacter flagellatus TaxID=1933044 RepID=UPI0021B22C06|nr:DUF1800 domain-containing protein [Edaphobacter flagellatus]